MLTLPKRNQFWLLLKSINLIQHLIRDWKKKRMSYENKKRKRLLCGGRKTLSKEMENYWSYCCKEKPCVMQKDPDLLMAKIVLYILLVRRL